MVENGRKGSFFALKGNSDPRLVVATPLMVPRGFPRYLGLQMIVLKLVITISGSQNMG